MVMAAVTTPFHLDVSDRISIETTYIGRRVLTQDEVYGTIVNVTCAGDFGTSLQRRERLSLTLPQDTPLSSFRSSRKPSPCCSTAPVSTTPQRLKPFSLQITYRPNRTHLRFRHTWLRSSLVSIKCFILGSL